MRILSPRNCFAMLLPLMVRSSGSDHGIPLIATICGALLLLSSARSVFAHGDPFVVGWDQVANQITVSPTIYRNLSSGEMVVYNSEFDVYTNTGEPGFDRDTSLQYQLPSNTAISLEVTGALHFWHPDLAAEDPLPEPLGILDIIGGGVASVSASGVTGNNPVAIAFLTTHHHLAWEMPLVDSKVGLYGFTARLVAGQPDNFSAAPSDDFLIVLNRGITAFDDYNAGVDRLAEAIPVPEPSTVSLVVAAGVAALAGWQRRRQRQA
jgi:hypothetical protein